VLSCGGVVFSLESGGVSPSTSLGTLDFKRHTTAVPFCNFVNISLEDDDGLPPYRAAS
jgi:hypothetical protein